MLSCVCNEHDDETDHITCDHEGSAIKDSRNITVTATISSKEDNNVLIHNDYDTLIPDDNNNPSTSAEKKLQDFLIKRMSSENITICDAKSNDSDDTIHTNVPMCDNYVKKHRYNTICNNATMAAFYQNQKPDLQESDDKEDRKALSITKESNFFRE